MSQTPVQSDLALWTTLRIRRRHVEQPRGLDAKAGRWITRIKKSRKGMALLNRQADAVMALEPQIKDLTDEQLNARIAEIRSVFATRKIDDDQLIAGTALVREVAGAGQDIRFDFASMGILPDGGAVIAYHDNSDPDPLFGVELTLPMYGPQA